MDVLTTTESSGTESDEPRCASVHSHSRGTASRVVRVRIRTAKPSSASESEPPEPTVVVFDARQ